LRIERVPGPAGRHHPQTRVRPLDPERNGPRGARHPRPTPGPHALRSTVFRELTSVSADESAGRRANLHATMNTSVVHLSFVPLSFVLRHLSFVRGLRGYKEV